MSKVFQSNVIRDRHADLTSSGNEIAPVVAIATTTEALALNHVFEMVVLPPGYGVADLKVGYPDDLDTNGAPALLLRCGFLKGKPGDTVFANRTTANAIGEEFWAASQKGRAPDDIEWMQKASGLLVPVSQERRSIGLQVQAAPATSAAAGARVVMVAYLRPLFAGV